MKLHYVELPPNIFKLVEKNEIRSILIESDKDYLVDDLITFYFNKPYTRFGNKIVTDKDGYEVLETIQDYKRIESKEAFRIKSIQNDEYSGMYGLRNYKIIYFTRLKEEIYD